MTNDGNYCIAKSDYDDSYYILDMNGNLIDFGNLNEVNLKFNYQLAEFDMPEKFDYDPDFANSSEIVVTAKRESGDGKLWVEATSDGKVIVYPPKKKESLEKLITNRN